MLTFQSTYTAHAVYQNILVLVQPSMNYCLLYEFRKMKRECILESITSLYLAKGCKVELWPVLSEDNGVVGAKIKVNDCFFSLKRKKTHDFKFRTKLLNSDYEFLTKDG